jgi:thioredoxin-related protein
MPKWIALGTILLIFILLLFFLLRTANHEELAIGSQLPELSFVDLAGDIRAVTRDSKMILIVYVQSHCEHCQYQLHVLNNYCKQLRGVRLYILTSDKNMFKEENKWERLMSAENVIVGSVDKSHFYQRFRTLIIPSIFIFDSSGKLAGKIYGEVKPQKLLRDISVIDSSQIDSWR